MSNHAKVRRWTQLAAKTLAAAAVAAAAGSVQADPANDVVTVPAAALPALARQSGEAMFLHDTLDGRTLLYVEQEAGSRLAMFDVSDPAHIEGKGSVPLEAGGAFDFISPLGDQAELVRFRNGSAEAVLELPRTKAPSLRAIRGADSLPLDAGVDPQPVRAQVTKTDTGTTFLLTENGLSVLRRPALESLHQLMIISPN